MQKHQGVVIDFGSSKITAVIGERGINGTFLIKGKFSYVYEGFADSVFFDEESVKKILSSIALNIKSTLYDKNSTIYVGVPSAFTQVEVKDSQTSFLSKRKIADEEINALFDSAFILPSTKYTLINRSAVVYELDDFRKVANPLGESSETLKGRLSFIVCDNYFIDIVKSVLEPAGFYKIELVSTSFAEALYLVDAETRDRISVVCDVGYISTSFFIVQGDGIIYEKEFAYGGGYITGALVEKYNIEFENAEKIKQKTNLCRLSAGVFDMIELDNGDFFPLDEVKDVIYNSLDTLCEEISNLFDNCGYQVPDYVPLYFTGGGIALLRGAKERVSDRLNMPVEILTPKIPLFESPMESSLFSLLDFATLKNKN